MKKHLVLLPWLGGKGRHVGFIRRVLAGEAIKFVDVFGGSGSVILNMPRFKDEVWNDVFPPVVNLMRVVQERPADLARALSLTPYSRREYVECVSKVLSGGGDALDLARSFISFSMMRVGANPHRVNYGSWSRARQAGTGGVPKSVQLKNKSSVLGAVSDRLQGVAIECRDALDVIRDHDSPDTLFYLDPPYVFSTRSLVASNHSSHDYYGDHEYPDEAHRELASVLNGIEGRAAVSGYASPLYDEELFTRELGWERHEDAVKGLPGSRGYMSEIVWTNYRAKA